MERHFGQKLGMETNPLFTKSELMESDATYRQFVHTGYRLPDVSDDDEDQSDEEDEDDYSDETFEEATPLSNRANATRS